MENLLNDSKLKEIMNRIQARRLELELSYQDLANKTNMSKSTLQRYETGSIKNMPVDKLGVIAKALNVNPIWLLGLDSYNKTHFNNENNLSKEEKNLLETFNKLNTVGKNEAIKRLSELTEINKYITNDNNVTNIDNFKGKKEKQIWEEPGKEHLMPSAAHAKKGDFSEEDYKHDMDIMNDDDFWND